MADKQVQEVCGPATEISIRVMTHADIPDGLRLRAAAGWNQTEEDWRRLLELEPEGCFAACEGSSVVGTVTTLRFEKAFGWIGMLLIDPAARKRGIGTLLLHRALAYLQDNGIECARLDGTPMGYNLYLKHGFADEYEIQRWEGISKVETCVGLPAIQETDLNAICRWDGRVFGADRSRLIECLWRRNPDCSAIVQTAGETAGYVLWRPGARAWYLGPCLADSAETARLLIREMLGRVPGKPVFIDVCTKNPWGLKVLDPFGFRYQRPLVRMYRGSHTHPGEPQYVYGIAGPELG